MNLRIVRSSPFVKFLTASFLPKSYIVLGRSDYVSCQGAGRIERFKYLEGMMVNGRKKRIGQDRRAIEAGPPSGWSERRKSVERRLPDVADIPFSEWLAHLHRNRSRSPQEA